LEIFVDLYQNNEMERSLYYNATLETFEKAKALRSNMTRAEVLVWKKIKNRQLSGFKFRRQHPIDKFIADFYCHKVRLVVEIDGPVHNTDDQKEYDIGRTSELERYGIQVIRFTNEKSLIT
jgi:very-short-patch-repair endonuclease